MERYGCFFHPPNTTGTAREYLPQVGLDAHATILSSSTRTALTQTFLNPSKTDPIPEVSYAFPLYDGVSVVDFTCRIGETVIQGVVKPKEEANQIYEEARKKGQTTAVMHQSRSASDVFLTRLGNVPADGKVVIEITVLGELKQDAQTDGLRYTLPNKIAPRYGARTDDIPEGSSAAQNKTSSIKVDVVMEKGLVIRSIQSPSHPIKVDLGRASYMPESTFEPCYASASLGVGGEDVVIEEDFILTVNADKTDTPSALLESHPTIPNQKALMVSLVPKFGLPSSNPEIVFVIDRSGSMGDKIATLKSALRVFLKSLPVGVHFNIISFGSNHKSLWPRSQVYDKKSLEKALKFTETIDSDMGGTEILGPLEAAVEKRYKDKDLEVLLLTDGEVWDQQNIFNFITSTVSEIPARFFSLGIGSSASHSLIEGMARAGNGFSQSVTDYEELDRKVIRMLKGALTPHISEYTLDLHVPPIEEDDYEVVEPVKAEKPRPEPEAKPEAPVPTEPISLYDSEYKEPEKETQIATTPPLPKLSIPATIQSPAAIPTLYPFIRTTVYVLFSPKAGPFPDKITLHANSKHGRLSLDIPVVEVGEGETIHQLAAKKAMLELEEGRGWIRQVKDSDNTLICEKYESHIEALVKNECERLGTRFRVAGQHCSFVAVDTTKHSEDSKDDYKLSLIRPEKSNPWDTYDPTILDDDDEGYHQTGLLQTQLAMGSVAVSRARSAPRVMARMPSSFASFGRGGGSPSLPPPPPPPAAPAAPAPSLAGSIDSAKKKRSSVGSKFAGFFKNKPGSSGGAALFSSAETSSLSSEARVDSVSGKVHSLIALQTFDGPWEWSEDLLKVMDLNVSKTVSELQTIYKTESGEGGSSWDKDPHKTIFATALVGIFFEHKAPSSKDIWELVKDKADAWVKTTLDSLSEKDRETIKKIIDRLGEVF